MGLLQQLNSYDEVRTVKIKFYVRLLGAAGIACVLLLFSGCTTNGEKQEAEKGKIEKMTDQAAETAVKKIRTPQEKARAARDLGNDRLEAMDKAVQQQ